MFKKFEEKENISGVTQLKSSVQKGIRNSILDTYPDIKEYIDNFLPKKDQFKVTTEPLFFCFLLLIHLIILLC